MWDNKKTVLALIIAGTVILIALIVFVLFWDSRSTNVAQISQNDNQIAVQHPATQPDIATTDESPRSSGDSGNAQDNLTQQPTPTPSSSHPSGNQSPTQTQPTPTPTPPFQQTVYLQVPGDPNFTAATLTVTQQNDAEGVKAYISNLNKAVSGFDLLNSFLSIQVQIQNVIQSGDPQSFNPILATIKQKQAGLVAVPVPSRVLGISQNYYLAYARLYDLLSLEQQYFTAKVDNPGLENQIGAAQDDFTSVADVLTNGYDVAKQIANQ